MASKVSKKESKSALWSAFEKERPNAGLNEKGYTKTNEENLIEGVRMEDFEEDLRQGNGNELECKFRAVHSSSALVVNCFAPFKRHLPDLRLLDKNGFECLQLEKKCPTGMRGTPPNLDVVIKNRQVTIGIESKFTEYIAERGEADAERGEADNLEKYLDKRRDCWCEKWFNEMEAIRNDRSGYTYLDVAQLIKHAFGIRHTLGSDSILLYLYWEPTNASQHENFKKHQDEIEKLKEKVSEATPSFAAMSYAELWQAWSNTSPPVWLAEHLRRLRGRYEVAV